MIDPQLSPDDLPLKTVAFIIGLSLVGGLAHFIDRVRLSKLRVHWLIELTGDVCYSLAAGFSSWYLARAAGLCEYTAAAMAIIAGHLGARWLFMLQHAMAKRLINWIDGRPADSTKREDEYQ